jgi:hypothetical protein
MSVIKFVKHKALTDGDISLVIQMAWKDRTSLETIKERVEITETEVRVLPAQHKYQIAQTLINDYSPS